MKQTIIALFLSLILLVGCTVEPALPTAAPVAQAPTTIPTSLPTATLTVQASATSLVPSPTVTLTPEPSPTDIPIVPTATPKPTQRPTRPPDMLDPSLSPPTGQILMFWDPHPPEYVDNQFTKALEYNFYRFTPGTTPIFDIIDAASAYIPYSRPILNVSPDQRKLALLLYEDTNENGILDLSGYDTDNETIYIYDVANRTLTPFASGAYSINYTTWFPDSQALLYPQGNDIFLARLDGSPSEPFLNFPDTHINNITLSPDGHSLVVYGNDYQIRVYDLDIDKVVTIADDTQFRDMKSTQWSSDGSWLAFGQHGLYSSRPLSLFNAETLEFTVSVALDEEDIVSIPSWSPDGQWLAFTTNQTTLSLWNRNKLAMAEMLTGTFVSPPIWSPIDNQITVGLIQENTGKLLAINIVTGNTQEWVIGTDIQEIRVLSWSPDGNWVAFIAIGTDNSGLYIAPKQGEKVYLMLDLNGDDAIGEFVWMPDP